MLIPAPTAALLKMPFSLYCFCKAQCSVGLSLCSRPLTIIQVINVLNEVASVTANRLVCRYLSHTNYQFLFKPIIDAYGRRGILLPPCYCSQTNLSYSYSLRQLLSCNHRLHICMMVDVNASINVHSHRHFQ